MEMEGRVISELVYFQGHVNHSKPALGDSFLKKSSTRDLIRSAPGQEGWGFLEGAQIKWEKLEEHG